MDSWYYTLKTSKWMLAFCHSRSRIHCLLLTKAVWPLWNALRSGRMNESQFLRKNFIWQTVFWTQCLLECGLGFLLPCSRPLNDFEFILKGTGDIADIGRCWIEKIVHSTTVNIINVIFRDERAKNFIELVALESRQTKGPIQYCVKWQGCDDVKIAELPIFMTLCLSGNMVNQTRLLIALILSVNQCAIDTAKLGASLKDCP